MTRMIEFVEVGPRNGLQNEKTLISTSDKLELVRGAIARGARSDDALMIAHSIPAGAI